MVIHIHTRALETGQPSSDVALVREIFVVTSKVDAIWLFA